MIWEKIIITINSQQNNKHFDNICAVRVNRKDDKDTKVLIENHLP
jgi:hypothetical protein